MHFIQTNVFLHFSHIVLIFWSLKFRDKFCLSSLNSVFVIYGSSFSLENSTNVSPIIQLQTSISQAKTLSSLHASPIRDHDYFKHFFFLWFVQEPRRNKTTCTVFLVLYLSYVVLRGSEFLNRTSTRTLCF